MTAEDTRSGRRWRPGVRWRRAASAVALLAGLGATGLAGGHVLGALGANGGAEHGRYDHHGHGHGDDDGVVFAPLPAPVAPPAPGR
jgi:hypothetical protein